MEKKLQMQELENTLTNLKFECVWQSKSFRLLDNRSGKEYIFCNKKLGLIAHVFMKKMKQGEKSYYFCYGHVYGEGFLKPTEIPCPLSQNITILNGGMTRQRFCINLVKWPEHFKIKIDSQLKKCINQLKTCYDLNSKWKLILPFDKFDLVSDKESQYDGWELRIAEIAQTKLNLCPIEVKRIINPWIP